MRCGAGQVLLPLPHREVRAQGWAAGGRAAAVAEEPALVLPRGCGTQERPGTQRLSGSAEEGPVPPPLSCPVPSSSTGEQSPPLTQLQGSTVGFPSNWDRGVSPWTEMTVQERETVLYCWCADAGTLLTAGIIAGVQQFLVPWLHGCWRRDPWPLQALGLSQQLPGALHRGSRAGGALGSVEGLAW